MIGRFLTRSGLDQLPVLINVLRGEMSIIGPHCHIVLPSMPLSDQLSLALLKTPLKPGLFNFEGPDERAEQILKQIEADLFYVSNWSLLLDAKILFSKLFSKTTYVHNYLHR